MDSELPTAVASGMGAIIAGEPMEPGRALQQLAAQPHLICHSAFFIERLGVAAQATRAQVRAAREQKHLDIAELFAFTCPARFATPTPTGFARSACSGVQSCAPSGWWKSGGATPTMV